MNRKITFAPGEFYHIYNRGTDKRIIFTNSNDYNRFTLLLYLCNSNTPVNIDQEFRKGRTFSELFKMDRRKTIVDIGAYCLMPNHFHLLLHEREEGGLSQFMKKLSTAYVMYFNSKNNRSGALFEGKFKAKHVTTDNYLKYLFAYIHLNPIKIIDPHWKENSIINKEEAYEYLKEYRYSSYLDYAKDVKNIGRRSVVSTKSFPNYFENSKSFESFIEDWLTFAESDE